MYVSTKEAAELFELGVFKGMTVMRDAMDGSRWMIIWTATKTERTHYLQTARGKPKTYASLDSAMKDIETIMGRIDSFDVRQPWDD